MKKVMIGILILIPVLILVIIAAVSSILKMAAWIAVDDILVVYRNTLTEADSIEIEFPGKPTKFDFDKYLEVKVMPEYANRYSIEWRISDVQIMDDGYRLEYKNYQDELKEYGKYLDDVGYYDNQIKDIEAEIASAKTKLDEDLAKVPGWNTERREQLQKAFDGFKAEKDSKINELKAKKDSIREPDVRYVANAAILVDDNSKEVSTNTSGEFLISSYCRFTLTVQVENVNAALNVLVTGENVESIAVVDAEGSDKGALRIGEKVRVNANYTPVSSIVTETHWHSSDESVATVDGNGVITAVGLGEDGKGEAEIYVEANRKDNGNPVKSAVYSVKVSAGASRFGSVFSTSKENFTLSEIGVKPSDVLKKDDDDGDEYDCIGCSINKGNLVTITDGVATIATKNGTVTINKCGADDIVIENADIYNAAAGYVFEVSGLTLKLRAVWADVLKEGTPDGVVWEVGDDYSKIITIDENGEVSAHESGLVEDIRAVRNGKTAALTLNVQVKLAAMSLRTGNAYFAVGLARETVFAAEKYRFENSDSTDKDPNSALIRIIGEPKAPKPEDFDNAGDYEKQYTAYKKQLATFYNAYKYEVVASGYYVYNEKGQHVKDESGRNKIEPVNGIYALFSDDASEPNRLTFIPSALKGQGRLTLRVKVSAKYPKYEGNDSYTSEEVDINVIYGVEVNTIAELRKASAEQKVYAFSEGNWRDKTLAWEHNSNVEAGGRDVLYRYYDSEYSLTAYGISVMSNIRYGDERDDDGKPVTVYDSTDIKLYGDLYGNGNMLSAEYGQVNNVDAMLWICWSNITVSNLTIRANKMDDKNGTLTTDETQGLQGQCLQIFHESYMQKNRIGGIRVEYCILENARRALQSYNADYTVDGVVIRNIDSVAFYVPARMYDCDEDGIRVFYPIFSHVTVNNSVFANCLNTIGSYSYERFSVGYDDASKTRYERFIAGNPAANAEHFRKYFIAAGVNTRFTQTGFLDVYNWQDVNNANVIDTGDKNTNELVGTLAGSIFKSAKEFEKLRYTDKDTNACYLHMGLLSTGISFNQGIMDEPSYLEATFEDERFGVPIRTRELPESASGLINVIRGMEIVFYGYDSTRLSKQNGDILPGSIFYLTGGDIDRLHS